MSLGTKPRPGTPTAAGATRAAVGIRSARARFAARARAVRRRPWVMVAGLCGLLLLAAAAVWLVGFSSALSARQVSAVGVPAGVRDEAVALAKVPLGTPLARLDTAAIARRVIAIPTLAEVTVTRSYPSTVVISAKPRVAVLAVRSSASSSAGSNETGGDIQLVDRLGVAYTRVERVPRGVPLVTAAQDPPAADALRSAIAVLQALPADTRRNVSELKLSSANLVTFRVKVGGRAVAVVWGGPTDLDLKVRVMSVLLNQQGVRSVDVSAPRTPVTT